MPFENTKKKNTIKRKLKIEQYIMRVLISSTYFLKGKLWTVSMRCRLRGALHT